MADYEIFEAGDVTLQSGTLMPAVRVEEAAGHEDADAARRELGALQDELLDTPAPHLTAVRQKLEVLWEARLGGLDRDSEERRLILEDLEDLIQTQHQLLGV